MFVWYAVVRVVLFVLLCLIAWLIVCLPVWFADGLFRAALCRGFVSRYAASLYLVMRRDVSCVRRARAVFWCALFCFVS